MLKRIWTVSTLLSLSRIVLLIPLGYFLTATFSYHRFWAAGIIALAVMTDFLDGFVARKLHQVTDFGKIIDPIADKIDVGVVSVLLVLTGDLEIWFVVFVLLRDLLVLAGGIYIQKKKKIIAQSNWPGKFAVSFVALVLFLSTVRIDSFEWLRVGAIWASVVLMVISFWAYSQRLFIGTTIGKLEG